MDNILFSDKLKSRLARPEIYIQTMIENRNFLTGNHAIGLTHSISRTYKRGILHYGHRHIISFTVAHD